MCFSGEKVLEVYRDANLWKPKIGRDCLFFTTPFRISTKPSPPPEKLTQPPMGMT